MNKYISLTVGEIRALTRAEQKLVNSKDDGISRNYKYVVLSEFKCTDHEQICSITVPEGFLTDGSSGGPSIGCSWLFHDYLYATHRFDNGMSCTRQDADKVMSVILENDRMFWYACIFRILAKWNVFWLFSSAWKQSGSRGPEFLEL